jgi:16S rRNA C967 or C1407 C5-methylase (RsmB/RsmF family)/NOL1/NOP2/fmu family ribosome biogenesis protein
MIIELMAYFSRFTGLLRIAVLKHPKDHAPKPSCNQVPRLNPMIERLESLIGLSEIKDFHQALASRPPKSIRPRIDRSCSIPPFSTTPVPWYPQGLQLLDPNIRPGGFLEYAAADYYIQDSASMLPLAMLDIQPDDWICDLCAAPGGKASAIAENLGPDGFLLANEVISGRLDVLRYALSRTGRANYAICNLDPEPLADALAGRFDKVLVDVPCSGQSLLGRKRQSDSSFSASHVQHCAARAKRILTSALGLVRPGGRLVLSTCTFAIEENEAQIDAILEAYGDSVSTVEFVALKNWESAIRQGCYRLWPHRDRCAGGFAAAIEVKNAIEPIAKGKIDSRTDRSRSTLKHSSKPPKSKLNSKLTNSEDLVVSLGQLHIEKHSQKAMWFGYEPGAMRFTNQFGIQLAQGLRIAQFSADRIEPYLGLAMLASELFEPAQVLELDSPSAESFMLGQSLLKDPAIISTSSTPWCVAKWKGKPLGWLKSASNRWNNYLPTWARFTSFATNSSSNPDDEPLE